MSYISAPHDQVKELRERLVWMMIVICGIMLLLAGRLWELQILHGSYYLELSEQNRMRSVPIKAPRGLIFDRHGRIIVNNAPSLNLYLVRADMTDPETTIAEIGQVLGWSIEEIQRRMRVSGQSPVAPVLIKQGLSLSEAARLEAHRLTLSGVKIEVEARREYLYGTLASHLLGYVGEITAEQIDMNEAGHAAPGTIIGQSGVERAYDRQLRGRDGLKRIEVDALGYERQVVNAMAPSQGNDVILTIDLDLQRVAEESLGDRPGAVIVLDPKNGELLAMVSHPAPDPNVLSGSMSQAQWQSLLTDPDHPLTNRTIQGVYPPASVFKIVVATAALESGQVTLEDEVECRGGMRFGRRFYRDWKPGGHGSMSLIDALVQSCDVYFYTVGSQMGVDLIARYAATYGLGKPTGIPLLGERRGVIPSTAWKISQIGEPWFPGETLSVAIGQSYVGTTPIQLANMMAVVANRGVSYQPHLIRAIRDRHSGRLSIFPPVQTGVADIQPETFDMLQQALAAVLTDDKGTARGSRSRLISIGGKTGTAQVVSSQRRDPQSEIPRQFRDHAWFVAFAPVEDPALVVAVLVEHGGHGGATAAPVAKQIIEAYAESYGPTSVPRIITAPSEQTDPIRTVSQG